MKIPKKIVNELSDFPYRQIPEFYENLVEVFDNRGEVFMLMPLEMANKKKMLRRIIFVILKDNKNRVLLSKKNTANLQTNSLWSLSGHNNIFVGESAIGAALQELKNNFYIDDIAINELRTLPFIEQDIPLSATVFSAGPYKKRLEINSDYVTDAMFVDKDELSGLLEFQPDMFSPLLSWALRSGWIF